MCPSAVHLPCTYVYLVHLPNLSLTLVPSALHHVHLPCAFVQYVVEAADWHVLADDDKVGRRVGATDDRQHVRVGEDPANRLL